MDNNTTYENNTAKNTSDEDDTRCVDSNKSHSPNSNEFNWIDQSTHPQGEEHNNYNINKKTVKISSPSKFKHRMKRLANKRPQVNILHIPRRGSSNKRDDQPQTAPPGGPSVEQLRSVFENFKLTRNKRIQSSDNETNSAISSSPSLESESFPLSARSNVSPRSHCSSSSEGHKRSRSTDFDIKHEYNDAPNDNGDNYGSSNKTKPQSKSNSNSTSTSSVPSSCSPPHTSGINASNSETNISFPEMTSIHNHNNSNNNTENNTNDKLKQNEYSSNSTSPTWNNNNNNNNNNVNESNSHFQKNQNELDVNNYSLEELVDYINSSSIPLSSQYNQYDAAFHIAVKQQKHEIVQRLLDKRQSNEIDFNLISRDPEDQLGATVLHKATLNDDVSMLRILIEEGGIPVNASRDRMEGTPLHWAACNNKTNAMVVLAKHTEDRNVRDHYGYPPLLLCLKNGFMEAAEALLLFGADISFKALNTGASPLHVAAENGDQKSVEFLIRHGAEINVRDSRGDTPVMRAALKGHKDTVEVLLKHKASCGVRNDRGQSLLHMAAYSNCRDILMMIGNKNQSECSVMINEGDQLMARTPLHIAVHNNKERIARLLLTLGASLQKKDTNDDTPLHMAARNGNRKLARYLYQSIHSKDKNKLLDAKNINGLTVNDLCEQNGIEL